MEALVLMRLRNAAPTLPRALSSLVNQEPTGCPLRVMVDLDGGTTDATEEVLWAFFVDEPSMDLPCEIHRRPPGTLLEATWRSILYHVRETDRVFFLDGDGDWSPSRLRRQLSLHPEGWRGVCSVTANMVLEPGGGLLKTVPALPFPKDPLPFILGDGFSESGNLMVSGDFALAVIEPVLKAVIGAGYTDAVEDVLLMACAASQGVFDFHPWVLGTYHRNPFQGLTGSGFGGGIEARMKRTREAWERVVLPVLEGKGEVRAGVR